MAVMSAFDIPIHTKNISTRDFAVRPEIDAQVHKKERPPAMHACAVLLASSMTVWYALQQSLTVGMHLAPCIQFYVAAVVPLLLYEHILAPSRSKNMWALLVLHIGSMLLAFPYDREVLSFRLHALVLVLSLALQYQQWPPAQNYTNLLAVAAILNSAASLCIHAEHPHDSSLHYHLSFVLLFASVVVMLYAV
jgi:hypothetical protein